MNAKNWLKNTIRAIAFAGLVHASAFAAEVPEPESSKKGEVVTEPVLILHKGDPFPPADVLYSYDSKETKADFERRRMMIKDIDKKGLAPHEILCRT